VADPHKLFRPEVFRLSDAREWFFKYAKHPPGAICPCCDRFGKVYARKFNKGMATNLIYLYQHAKDDFIHLPSTAPRYILKDNQVGKLVFWDMAVPQVNDKDPSKNKSGSWRITEEGIAFVEGRIKVWSHVIEYNQNVLGFRDKKLINISDALGRPFHYQELMADSP
jgi:hypothetical protein